MGKQYVPPLASDKMCLWLKSNTTTTTVLWPFFQDHPGEPVPEENFWINRGRHTDHPAGHHSIPTNQCPPSPYPFFTGRSNSGNNVINASH